MPAAAHLVRWQKDYGARGLQIVAVYRPGEGDSLDAVRKLAQDKGMTFPILFDAGRRISDAYGIRGLPVAYLLDPRGVVVWEGKVVRSKVEANPDLESAVQALHTGVGASLEQQELATKIGELLPKLGADSIEVRAAAQAELRRLVDLDPSGARAILKAGIASATGAETRRTLKAALARLPALELRIAPYGEARVGRAPGVRVRILNLSEEVQTVVRALDGSDAGARYPRFDVQIFGPDGKREDKALGARGNDLKPLAPGDFNTVAPGGEVDPFGEGGVEHGILKGWRPARAGRYTIRISADYTERNIGHWMGTAAMKSSYLEELERLLARVPNLRMEASITIEVR